MALVKALVIRAYMGILSMTSDVSKSTGQSQRLVMGGYGGIRGFFTKLFSQTRRSHT